MLDDLRRLRELQLAQGRALERADLGRLDELDHERAVVQARIIPGDAPPLSAAELEEARALVRLLRADQDTLLERAAAARDTLRREIGGLGVGRAALAGYRPAPIGNSLYLDRSR